mgnify:CR=1 FL=1
MRTDEATGDAGRIVLARGAAAGRLLLQHVRRPGGSHQGTVGAGREPAAAAQRPDPEPRGDGEGLRPRRSRDVFKDIADSRAKLAGAKTPDEKMAAANEQIGGALAPARRRRELPDLEVERVVQPADGRAVGHREPHRRRADALQRDACRPTTRRAGSSPPTSRPGLFGFKEYKLFEAPPEAKADAEGGVSRPAEVVRPAGARRVR